MSYDYILEAVHEPEDRDKSRRGMQKVHCTLTVCNHALVPLAQQFCDSHDAINLPQYGSLYLTRYKRDGDIFKITIVVIANGRLGKNRIEAKLSEIGVLTPREEVFQQFLEKVVERVFEALQEFFLLAGVNAYGYLQTDIRT